MTKTTSAIDNACQTLELMDARAGLGKRLFEAISSLTPSVSVELIIRSADQKHSLLTWRDDELYGPGWHVPGGVVRFKENMINRVETVVHQEIGVPAKSIEGQRQPNRYARLRNTRDTRRLCHCKMRR